jgi:hypothetical protein
MALWGNSDNVTSAGLISLNYNTGICTGSGTAFGAAGSAQEGDVIRFGDRSGTYMGDAVIVSIASTIQCSIASTSGLSGVAIAETSFNVSQCPTYSVGDSTFSEASFGVTDKVMYGVAEGGVEGTTTTQYALDHGGWVGVTTYLDQHGTLRVKKEVLVAMSGITTGNSPVYDSNPLD